MATNMNKPSILLLAALLLCSQRMLAVPPAPPAPPAPPVAAMIPLLIPLPLAPAAPPVPAILLLTPAVALADPVA